MAPKLLLVLDTFKTKSQDRLFLFRLFATILAVDFIAFLSLASISPLRLLNPLGFLSARELDSRPELKLYFPRAFKTENSEQQSELLETKQKVYQLTIPEGEGRTNAILENARHITAQLEAGSDDMKARRIIKEKNSFLDFWLYRNTLIVRINPTAWSAIPAKEQPLAQASVEKSLAANLPVEAVVLDFSARP